MKTKIKTPGFTLAFLFCLIMLVLRGMTSCEAKEVNYADPIHADCQGKLFDSCEQDSVTYEQHPNKKCWHTNWENR